MTREHLNFQNAGRGTDPARSKHVPRAFALLINVDGGTLIYNALRNRMRVRGHWEHRTEESKVKKMIIKASGKAKIEMLYYLQLTNMYYLIFIRSKIEYS